MKLSSIAVIDWFTFSVKGAVNPDQVIKDYLHIDVSLFTDCPFGLFGYSKSKTFGNIKVLYAPAEDRIYDMGVCVTMSGSGCREFERYTTYKHAATPFFPLIEKLHIDDKVNVTRVDLALDDKSNYLDIDIVTEAVRFNAINTRIRKRSVTESWEGKNPTGKTVYIGSSSSDFRIRIYDKAKEQFKADEPGYNNHWVRLEMVMRGDNADGFCSALVNTDDLGVLASGILNDKISFINLDDNNISRCSVCSWWTDFVDSIATIKLVSKEEITHKIEDVIEWVSNQIAPSLSLICDAKGYFQIADILKIGAKKRSSKQNALLDDYLNSQKVC